MQYFPTEGHFDKMYFPYYGKKAHVSIITELKRSEPESELTLVMVIWVISVILVFSILYIRNGHTLLGPLSEQ